MVKIKLYLSLLFSGIVAGITILCSCTVSPVSSPETLAAFYHQTPVPLTLPEPKSYVNGIFPDQVYIKTLSQTFCRDYQFCLVDGLIYYKLMPDAGYSNPGKDETEWQLINGTGLPDGGKDFPVPEQIVEISADADSLFAFDSAGGMYQMFTNDNAPGKPFEWLNTFGWPEKTHLVQNQLVKDKRAWAAGTRRQDVLWHEDIFGNPHHYGTMGIETLYFLTEDGQHIRFTDSGLPSDFSRSLLGPERGAFIAENLSASASTMFVINKAGVMYTRLADFDTIGCDPMFFRYTYEKLPQQYTGADYWSNYSPWGLPSEPWLRQPEIPLSGNARLTRYITIFQNGQGNAARELRVAGLNDVGETGFYHKAIMDMQSEDWKFTAVPLYLEESVFLPVTSAGLPAAEQENLTGEKQEASYQGFIWQNGIRNKTVICSIPDFPLSEGGCTLYLSYLDETKRITIHPVEMWSYMFRNDPGYDGTEKKFFATFEFDPDQLKSKYPEFESLLTKILGGKNKEVFSSTVAATEDYLRLTVDYREQVSVTRPLSARSDDEIPVTAVTAPQRDQFIFFMTNTALNLHPEEKSGLTSVLYSSTSLNMYGSPELRLIPGSQIPIEDRDKLDQAVQDNIKYIQMLESELDLYNEYASKADISRWGYNAVDLLTTITLLNQINFPKIKNMTSFGDRIMAENARTYKAQAESKAWSYSQLIELLRLRIQVYEDLQKQFSASQHEVTVPVKLRDTYNEFFQDAAVPFVMTGNSQLKTEYQSTMRLLPELPIFPGFCVVLNDEAFSVILVKLTDAAAAIYNLKEPVSENNPLRLDAHFYAFSVSGILPAELEDINRWRGQFYWDGEELTVTAKTGFFRKKTVFSGTLTETLNDVGETIELIP